MVDNQPLTRPYLFTIVILVIITRSKGIRRRAAAPAALGLPFEREGF
jgi:ABC-type uncharacterized transport system permease subunit